MILIQQSDATADNRWFPFYCCDDDAADNFAPKTGLTFASGELKIAKRGGASANAINYATVVEAGNGWYWYQATQSECNTLGLLMLTVNKTDVYSDASIAQVVPWNPYSATNLGLSNLDATMSSRLASADYEDADALLDLANGVETGLTLRQALRAIAAEALGKIGGVGTNTVTARAAITDSKVRVTATLDSSGNRTGVATDLS